MAALGRHRPSMAPPLDRVVERPELGRRLLDALVGLDDAAVGTTTCLQGAGGFGKTTLATWACHQPEIQRLYQGGMLWITVGQEVGGAGLASKINDLAFIMTGHRPAIADPDAAGAELGRILRDRAPVLLVVDDVWSEQQVRPFRFQARACKRLVITRLLDLLPEGIPRLEVNALTPEQARELVRADVDDMTAQEANRLSALGGRWPVVLNLVNGAVRRRVARGQPRAEAVEAVASQIEAEGPAAFDPAQAADRHRAVAATVEASLVLLTPVDRRRYLDLAIFPEDVDIPLEMVSLLWPNRNAEALCEEFVGLGLVAELRLGSPGSRLVMHDVMRSHLLSLHTEASLSEAHNRLVDTARQQLPPTNGSEPAWWTLPERLAYLWRHLAYHLHHAGAFDELARVACDLRWVEAKTCRLGSVAGAQSDLDLVDAPTAELLGQALGRVAHLLGPLDPTASFGATLAAHLDNIPGLEDDVAHYRAGLQRPLLVPTWPLPSDTQDAEPSGSPGLSGGITSCAYSPDGSQLVTTGDEGTVMLWQLPEGRRGPTLRGHTGAVRDCVYLHDGQSIMTASDDGTGRLWRLHDATAHAVLGHPDRVTSCAVTADGVLGATTCGDGSVRLWDVATGDEHAELTRSAAPTVSCAFSPDGALLAATAADGATHLWDVATLTPVRTLDGHSGMVLGCAFSPDGAWLATVGTDATARLTHLISDEVRVISTDHYREMARCMFSPDGSWFVTAGKGGAGRPRTWRTATGEPGPAIHGHGYFVTNGAISPDGAVLATTSVDQTVHFWSLADGERQAVLRCSSTRINACDFSPDGQLVATTKVTGVAAISRTRDGSTHTELPAREGALRGCSFSPDSTVLAVGGNDATIHLWHLASRTETRTLEGHTGWVFNCAYSADSTLLATASSDHTARLWAMPGGTDLRTLHGHTDWVFSCAFSPDDALLATASGDTTGRLWRVADGSTIAVLRGHTDEVGDCSFSPDGTILATASDDHTVRLWSVADGSALGVLRGHTNWVSACSFSPDGTLLATCGQDWTVRLWSMPGGQPHCALRLAGPLMDLAWHPDGKRLCVVGGPGTHLLGYEPDAPGHA